MAGCAVHACTTHRSYLIDLSVHAIQLGRSTDLQRYMATACITWLRAIVLRLCRAMACMCLAAGRGMKAIGTRARSMAGASTLWKQVPTFLED
jgi:hypothetical protein